MVIIGIGVGPNIPAFYKHMLDNCNAVLSMLRLSIT
jgi:hypothetical protein